MYQVKIENSQFNADTKYVPSVEVAKYVRSLLKAKFPGVKFSVRKESTGTVNVSWQRGAVAGVVAASDWTAVRRDEMNAVEAVIGALHGEGFDGMIDMRYSREHYVLPSGEIVYAGTRGTQGSGGYVEAREIPAPAGAQRVRLSNDFIFCQASF